MDRSALKAQLTIDEGLRLRLYRCTAGKQTIGVGRNIEDKGISKAAADFLLEEDIRDAEADADKLWPDWRKASEARQQAFVNFVFNLGYARAAGFVNTLRALKQSRWEDAAKGFEASAWYSQVGDRAKRIVAKIRHG